MKAYKEAMPSKAHPHSPRILLNMAWASQFAYILNEDSIAWDVGHYIRDEFIGPKFRVLRQNLVGVKRHHPHNGTRTGWYYEGESHIQWGLFLIEGKKYLAFKGMGSLFGYDGRSLAAGVLQSMLVDVARWLTSIPLGLKDDPWRSGMAPVCPEGEDPADFARKYAWTEYLRPNNLRRMVVEACEAASLLESEGHTIDFVCGHSLGGCIAGTSPRTRAHWRLI